MCAVTKSVTEGNTSHMTETTMTWENERTNKFQSSIYVQFGWTMGQKAKFLFQFQKQPWHMCRQQFLAPIQFKSNPFRKKPEEKELWHLRKIEKQFRAVSFIPFKEVWFSEASNKGFSAHSFQYITWAVDLHFFFNPSNRCEFTAMLLLHPQVTRLSSRLNDVAWHYATPQVRSHDIIKFQRRVHFLDKCFVHFS